MSLMYYRKDDLAPYAQLVIELVARIHVWPNFGLYLPYKNETIRVSDFVSTPVALGQMPEVNQIYF